MLPRSRRLRRSADLARVRQHGKPWRHPLAVLLVQENSLGASRFAFAASRQVGGAVVRNRVKRLMREAVRAKLEFIEEGWDCLFIARRAASGSSLSEIENAVVKLLSRSNIVSGQIDSSPRDGRSTAEDAAT